MRDATVSASASASGGRRRRTTKSSPARSCWRARNTSRTKRFTRLRPTARRTTLPATIKPSRGCARLLGLAYTWKNSPLTAHLNRITAVNSSAWCRRWLLGREGKENGCARIRFRDPTPDIASGRKNLNPQANPPLRPARADNGGTTTGFHANQKAMGAFSAGDGRLISTLHFFLCCR